MSPHPPAGAIHAPIVSLFTAVVALLGAGVAAAQQQGAETGPSLSRGTPFDEVLRWPLNDLGRQTYLGVQGGLYPEGRNERPDAHEQLGLSLAAEVVPRDGAGAPSSNGVIGVAAIGFSSTRLEWDAFDLFTKGRRRMAQAIRLVNCAADNQDASDLADPASPYWTTFVPIMLQNAGLTAAQVQVVWMLEGDRYIGRDFPFDAQRFAKLLRDDVKILHTVLPGVRLLYAGSSTYSGYARDPADGEPVVYDNAFGFKWLIEHQIAGDPDLNCDPALGPTMAPWLSWGPFLWSDGALPRSDGWRWTRDDVFPDGFHPSLSGATRVARELWHWFTSDVTATSWFCAAGHGRTGVPAFVERIESGTEGTRGEPRLSVSAPPRIPTHTPLHLSIDLGRPGAAVLFVLGDRRSDLGFPFGGLRLWVQPQELHVGTLDARGHGEYLLGAVPNDPALAGVERYAQAIVADPLGPDGSFALTAGLRMRLGD